MAHLFTIVVLATCATLVVSHGNQEVYDHLEPFDNLGAFDNLESRRNLETGEDLEAFDNQENQRNLETGGNFEAFDNLEALDMLEARENEETEGGLDSIDNLETLDNLDVLDKRLLQERALQLKDAEEFIDAKIAQLKSKLVDGFSGSDGKVSYKISNIKISDLALDLNPQIKFVNGLRSAELTLTLPRFTVDANWWARYKSWLIRITRDGSLTATANRISVTVTVSLSPLEVESCRSSADISVKVRGGGLVTKILLLFKKKSFVNKLEDKLEDVICDAINKL